MSMPTVRPSTLLLLAYIVGHSAEGTPPTPTPTGTPFAPSGSARGPTLKRAASRRVGSLPLRHKPTPTPTVIVVVDYIFQVHGTVSDRDGHPLRGILVTVESLAPFYHLLTPLHQASMRTNED